MISFFSFSQTSDPSSVGFFALSEDVELEMSTLERNRWARRPPLNSTDTMTTVMSGDYAVDSSDVEAHQSQGATGISNPCARTLTTFR